METIILTCIQCDGEFEFTVGEQKKFQQRGFDFPLRCHQCRKNKSKEHEHSEPRKSKDKKRRHRLKHEGFFDY